MKRASNFLKGTKEGVKREAVQIDDQTPDPAQTDAILQELEEMGIDTKRPRFRSECPTIRPCPFVSCRHHLYLDVMEDGELRINFKNTEVHELVHSCSLDLADNGPLNTLEVGKVMGLTRALVQQTEQELFEDIRENNPDLLEVLYEAINNGN